MKRTITVANVTRKNSLLLVLVDAQSVAVVWFGCRSWVASFQPATLHVYWITNQFFSKPTTWNNVIRLNRTRDALNLPEQSQSGCKETHRKILSFHLIFNLAAYIYELCFCMPSCHCYVPTDGASFFHTHSHFMYIHPRAFDTIPTRSCSHPGLIFR